ncbi:hypothetical protein T439DRAFT_384764 [Meredithblackwellia eburnea MCA 4105]
MNPRPLSPESARNCTVQQRAPASIATDVASDEEDDGTEDEGDHEVFPPLPAMVGTRRFKLNPGVSYDCIRKGTYELTMRYQLRECPRYQKTVLVGARPLTYEDWTRDGGKMMLKIPDGKGGWRPELSKGGESQYLTYGIGDYLIRGAKGEQYPRPRSEFTKFYQILPDSQPDADGFFPVKSFNIVRGRRIYQTITLRPFWAKGDISTCDAGDFLAWSEQSRPGEDDVYAIKWEIFASSYEYPGESTE